MRHVEELEQQLAGTMEQLAAMRQDLQEMQKSPLKYALQKTVHALEEKAEALRGQIAALKENIIEGCKQALAGFKEQGTAALDNLARFFHLRQGLASMQKTTESAIQLDNQAIKKIEAVSAEYHEAGKHLKNVGRTLMGKEAVQEAKPMGKLEKPSPPPTRRTGPACLPCGGPSRRLSPGWTGWNRRRRSRPSYRPCGNRAKK